MRTSISPSSSSPRISRPVRRVAKIALFGCILPAVTLATVALLWAIAATSAAADRLASTSPPGNPSGATGTADAAMPAAMGGAIEVPGLPSLPPEAVAAAIPALEIVASVARKTIGERSPEVGRELAFLAQLHGSLGNLDRAQQLYDEAFAILREQPAGRADLGWLSNNFGMLRFSRGETSAADELFRRALVALPTERHPFERAIALQNLASTASQLGDWQQAQAAFHEALALLASLGRQRTAAYARTEHNFAVLALAMGQHERARQICERLLARGEGIDPALRVALLNDLGESLRQLGRYDAAERRLREAAAATNEGSPAQAQVLGNLALVRLQTGAVAEAEAMARRALDVLEARSDISAAALVAPLATLSTVALMEKDFGRAEKLLSRARTLWQARGSADDPFAGSIEKGLAVIAWQRGDAARAKELASAALALDSGHFRRVLAYGSEAQRLAYRKQTFPYDLLANLGEARLVAEAVLTMKGAVLESLLAERAAGRRSAGDARAFETAAEATATTPAGEPDASPVAGGEVARVQGALAPGEALVELVHFGGFAGGPQLVPRYGAVVLAAAAEPTWVSLGSGVKVDGLVGGLRHCVWLAGRGAARGSAVDLDCDDPAVFAVTLATLHRALWEPLERALPAGTRRVILSADGMLHFVPWAALPDAQGRMVAERWSLVQATSGRDLLRPTRRRETKKLVALGRNGRFLAKAEEEARFVADLGAEHGWSAELLGGEQATERALFDASSPAILHVATHGAFERGAAAGPAGMARRPMLRSYVQLAGPPAATAAATRDERTIPIEDGLLTAEEAAALDLADNELVVLSACETGLGDVQAGEGVLGLRRGFALAGSRHLLFSLWRIDDGEAYSFMQGFYRRFFATGDPERAFEEVQREELVRLRNERSLRDAALAVGGFVLTR